MCRTPSTTSGALTPVTHPSSHNVTDLIKCFHKTSTNGRRYLVGANFVRLSEGRSWPLWPWVRTGPQREVRGSGPDRKGRSEGPGQTMAERTGPGGVQGQTLDGPDLGVRPGPDPDLAYSQIVFRRGRRETHHKLECLFVFFICFIFLYN